MHLFRQDHIPAVVPAHIRTIAKRVIMIADTAVDRHRQRIKRVHKLPICSADDSRIRMIIIAHIAAVYHHTYAFASVQYILYRPDRIRRVFIFRHIIDTRFLDRKLIHLIMRVCYKNKIHRRAEFIYRVDLFSIMIRKI